MKQVCLAGGAVTVLEVPAPTCGPGGVLVRTSHSVISTGTELASGGGGEGLLRRALANPQLVRRVWEKIETVGLRQTIDLVRARQTSFLPLGYSAAGEVIEVGREVPHLKVGDRVACAGAGYANHAEVNFVPQNLVSLIPDEVPYRAAAFATLGAIALQGVRRLSPSLGEQIVVIGLGLIGQLAVQLLRLSGCRVFGTDPLAARLKLARALGMEDGVTPDARDVPAAVAEWTSGVGADGVVVCASGGDTMLLNRAFDLTRRKGRVVLVGDVPIRISRAKIYAKEIDFLISSSYGPGRYDPQYEERGLDYPLAYVRWTEGRNLGEVLRLIAAESLRVDELIGATVSVENAGEAYRALQSPARPVAVVLDYGLAERGRVPVAHTVQVSVPAPAAMGKITLGVIGAGSFFQGVHLPNLGRHGGFVIKRVASRSGLKLHGLAQRYQIPFATTDAREVIDDPDVAAVVIATRHDLHAPLVLEAVRAGKHVFVEKPLALTVRDCEEILDATRAAGVLVMVGFNRRFSPLARRARRLMEPVREPKTVLYRVNAGPLPPDHWLRDPVEGGGRIRGEAVHFFDFARWLIGADPVHVTARALDRGAGRGVDADNVVVTLGFADGSLASVQYVSQGARDLAKERVELFGGGRAVVLDDFTTLEARGFAGALTERGRSQQKGYAEIWQNFHDALVGRDALGASAVDGYWATWCAERALESLRAAPAL